MVWGLGFEFWGLGFEVWGLGLESHRLGLQGPTHATRLHSPWYMLTRVYSGLQGCCRVVYLERKAAMILLCFPFTSARMRFYDSSRPPRERRQSLFSAQQRFIRTRKAQDVAFETQGQGSHLERNDAAAMISPIFSFTSASIRAKREQLRIVSRTFA